MSEPEKNERWDAQMRDFPIRSCGRLDMSTTMPEEVTLGRVTSDRVRYVYFEDGSECIVLGKLCDFVAYRAARYDAEIAKLREAMGAPDNATATDMVEARRQEQGFARNVTTRLRAERDEARAAQRKAIAKLREAMGATALERIASVLDGRDELRLRVQRSIDPGRFLAVLVQEGKPETRRALVYGKADTIDGAISAAVTAFEKNEADLVAEGKLRDISKNGTEL